VKLPTISASQLHYGLATAATLALIYKFVATGHADTTFSGFVVGFWGTAVANDRLNTPVPT